MTALKQPIKHSRVNSHQLPVLFEPKRKDATLQHLLDTCHNDNPHVCKLLRESGAILFRNFPLQNVSDFETVVKTLGLGELTRFLGTDPSRISMSTGIDLLTEPLSSKKVLPRQELSSNRHYPKHLYFYCQRAPEGGSEMLLVDARKVLKGLDPIVLGAFKEHGLMYVASYYAKNSFIDIVNRMDYEHASWRDFFQTEDKDQVEQLCRENELDFQWNRKDWLQITSHRPALMTHPESHEEVWFNQAHLYDLNPRLLGWWSYLEAKTLYSQKHTIPRRVLFGNGISIKRELLHHIMDVIEAHTVRFSMQTGDLLVLDNILTMHGNSPSTGENRMLTAMTEP